MGRTKRAITEVYKELKQTAKEIRPNNTVENTKSRVQNRKTRRRREVLIINDHGTIVL
jgi:hypothetical protein